MQTINVEFVVWGPAWAWELLAVVLAVLFVVWLVRFIVSIITGG